MCVFSVLLGRYIMCYYRFSDDMKLGQIKWQKVGKLTSMPDWAVDKHTFRGKYGKGTKHLVKKKPNGGK